MGDDLSDLRNRQTRTERRVAVLELTVDREAERRVSMNEKLDDILIKVGAHEKSLSALRQDQASQGKALSILRSDVATLKADMGEVKGHLVTVKAGVHAILDLLDANLGKPDDR